MSTAIASLNDILKSSSFDDNHIKALAEEGYDDLEGFSTLSATRIVEITTKGGGTPVKEGKAASALRKVTIALSTPATAPAAPAPAPAAPVIPGAPAGSGVQRLMMVNPYDGPLKDVLQMLIDNPEDDRALQRVTELTTDAKTGQPRETFITDGGVINADLSAELNQILARTGQVKLAGLYKGKKARVLTKALKVRMQADPRDPSVMLVAGTSTLDGVDWTKAWKNAHILTYARLYMPAQFKALSEVDGYTLAQELETASHPRYAAIVADMQLSEEEDQTKLANARQALIFKDPSDSSGVADSGTNFRGGRGAQGWPE